MNLMPQEYLGSVCEIKTLSNELVATGYIRAIEMEYLQINARNSYMPVLRYGRTVKINVFNSKLGFRVLVGKVYISNTEFLRITEVISLLDYEQRGSFRVSTDIHVNITGPKQEETEEPVQKQDEEKEKRPKIDRIINMSLGGVGLDTEKKFTRGDMLYLEFKVNHRLFAVRATIMHAREIDNEYQYGCEFVGMSENEKDALCAYIFERQRELLRSSNSSNVST